MSRQEFDALLRYVDARVGKAIVEGVRDAADELLSVSRDEVPYDQGDLSRSGQAQVRSGGDVVVGAVSYDQPPYDVVQHEGVDLRHDNGRKAHFLSDPVRERGDDLIAHIGRKVGDVLR